MTAAGAMGQADPSGQADEAGAAVAVVVAVEEGVPGEGVADWDSVVVAARRAFGSGLYVRAGVEFRGLAQREPESGRGREALAWALLAEGEAALLREGFVEAVTALRAFQSGYPGHPQAVYAAVREAYALLRSGNSEEVIIRLEREDGPFAQAAADMPSLTSDGTETPDGTGGRAAVVAGLLVMGEARLQMGDPAAATHWAGRAGGLATTPRERWEARLLTLRAAEAAGDLAGAREAAEGLRGLSADGELAGERLQANWMLVGVLERMGESEAVRPLLEETARGPEGDAFRRAAIHRLAEMDRAAGRLEAARERLERELAGPAGGAGTESLRHLLAQVLLAMHRERSGGGGAGQDPPGWLPLALQHLDAALTNRLTGDLLGRVQLTRGWCLWEDFQVSGRPERLEVAAAAFEEAERTLTGEAERAVARLKLGDVLMQRGQSGEALARYLSVAGEGGSDGVAAGDGGAQLVDYAWQQAAVAAVALTNNAVAERAVGALLERQAGADGGLRSILLVGQSMTRHGPAEQGRELLEAFLGRFPESPLRPDARMILATSWLRERNWTNALTELGRWLEAYPGHPSRPRVEFDRAWVEAQLGRTEAAVEQFRGLVGRHPEHPLALTAQLWLGDHFFNLGDFQRSEQAFAAVSTNLAWARGDAPYRARLLAAEAAVRGQRFGNARDYLLSLLNDKASPPELLPAGFFSLGNLAMQEAITRADGSLEGYGMALDAFRRVTQFTNSALLPTAWGRMAECHLQLAVTNTANYNQAQELFQRVVEHPGADLAQRAKAKVGLGRVLEKRAVLLQGSAAVPFVEQAILHHLDLVTGRILRPGEVADSWWVREAGLEAGRLMEQLGRWREAAGVYASLGQSVPEARAVWDARRQRALARAGPETE